MTVGAYLLEGLLVGLVDGLADGLVTRWVVAINFFAIGFFTADFFGVDFLMAWVAVFFATAWVARLVGAFAFVLVVGFLVGMVSLRKILSRERVNVVRVWKRRDSTTDKTRILCLRPFICFTLLSKSSIERHASHITWDTLNTSESYCGHSIPLTYLMR